MKRFQIFPLSIYYNILLCLSMVVLNEKSGVFLVVITTKKQTLHFCKVCCVGGGSGIRTHVGASPNGFQDRLVMTTSISLRKYDATACIIFTEFGEMWLDEFTHRIHFAYPTRRATSSLVRRRVWVSSPKAK